MKVKEYYSLKQELESKEKDLQTAEYEYNAIVNQEPYMAGRLKGRQRQMHILRGEINSLRKRIHSMMNKDTAEILRLSGFTIDSCGAKDDDATEGGAIEQYGKDGFDFSTSKSMEAKERLKRAKKGLEEAENKYRKDPSDFNKEQIGAAKREVRMAEEAISRTSKDGGPGSGVKGHTTSKEPSYTSRSGYNFEEPKVIEEAIKKVKASGHADPHYLSGLEQALQRSKKERGIKDSCGEKVFTKGTEDGCTKDLNPSDYDETMTTAEARQYWNKYHNSDPILRDYKSFEEWYRESKMNGYIKDSCTKDDMTDTWTIEQCKYVIAHHALFTPTVVEAAKKALKKLEAKNTKDSARLMECNEVLRLSGFITPTKDADGEWITMNGAHVKIEEGQSKGEAAEKFIAKKKGKEETSKNTPEKTPSAPKAAPENQAKPKGKKKEEVSPEEKAKARWMKKLEDEFELSPPDKVRKSMEENGEVDEEYLKNYSERYDIMLKAPKGTKVRIDGKNYKITDYVEEDEGEIYAGLNGGLGGFIEVKKLAKYL